MLGAWPEGQRQFQKVTLSDREVSSRYAEVYREGLRREDSPYAKANSTDAQGLTTLEEHVDVLWAFGKIDPGLYDRVKRAIHKAGPGGSFTFEEAGITKEEKAFLLQPMKPLYVGWDLRPEYGLANQVYTKSSS